MKQTIFIFVSTLIFIPQYLFSQTEQWKWAKSFGGDNTENANALACDADGNVYLAGEFSSSSIAFGSTTLFNTGVSDIFIIKLDSTGQILWANSFQGTTGSVNKATGLTVDSHDNVIITGYFDCDSLSYNGFIVNNSGQIDFFVAKISPAGDLIWLKSAAGSRYDMSKSVCTNHLDNIIVSGNFNSNTLSIDGIVLYKKGNGNPNVNGFIFQINEYGQAISGTNYGEDSDNGISIDEIKVKSDGNIVFSGNFTTPQIIIGDDTLVNLDTISVSTTYDAFLGDMSSDYTVNGVYQIAGSSLDYISDLDIDNDGNIVICGYFTSDTLIIGADTLFNQNNIDMFTALISSTGEPLWAKAIGGDILESADKCVFDNQGNVFVSVLFWADTLFVSNDTILGREFEDILLIKYTHDGALDWSCVIGSEGFDEPQALSIDDNNNVYIAGVYSSSMLFMGTDSLENLGYNDCFIGKISDYKNPAILPDQFLIFPNPGNGYITINPGTDFSQGYHLQVTNMTGQLVYEMQATDRQTQEHFLPYASGVYFVTIYNENIMKSAKLIIR